jgi:hypothetical protein
MTTTTSDTTTAKFKLIVVDKDYINHKSGQHQWVSKWLKEDEESEEE